MNGTNIWKYMRYLILAVMTMSISVSAISCIDTSPIGPAQATDEDEGEDKDPNDTTGD